MRRQRDAQREGGYMMATARDGHCHGLSNAWGHEKLEEAGKEMIPELQRKHGSANIFIFRFQPP